MKRTGKRLSLLLTLCLLLSLLPVTAKAAWIGAGNGTSESPYQISTAEELKTFRDIVNGENGEEQNTAACAVLTADIDLNNEAWTPIGNTTSKYTGIFDGNGKTISGLFINDPDGSFQGLFGYVDAAGKVREVGVVSGSVTGKSFVGSVVGWNYGTVENCYSKINATAKNYVGGVVGQNANNGTVENCYNTGSVSASDYSDAATPTVGGVVGRNFHATVNLCYNTGNITSTGFNAAAGGVVGQSTSSGKVQNCYNTGDVSGTSVGSPARIGGVVGRFSSATLTDCYYLAGTASTGIGDNNATATELGATQLTDKTSFAGFDFSNNWYMGAGGPILRAFIVTVDTWEDLQSALSAGGDIVLTADVTPENPYWADALTVNSSVIAALDLNGHKVNRGYTEQGFDGSVIKIYGTLTVTDSASGGSITGGFPDQYGGGVQILGGTFNLQGGSITGNSVGKTGMFGTEGLGGGIYLQSGTFNMSGGAITGNKALGSSMGNSLGRGGGVYISGGTFNFTGGEISDNDAGAIGGGVYFASTYSGHDGTINVSGDATVTDNTVGGAASNVFLEEGGVFTVAGELNGTIGVTMQTPGVFTSGLSGRGTKENFTSDDAGLAVSLADADEAQLGVEEYPLWVSGVQATSANKGDVLGDGGTASYDPDSNTLTLNNANITGMYQGHPLNRSIRTEDMDLTVALTGSNTVSGRIALAVYGELTITGGGSLTATGSASEVIYAKGNLTIDGCTISASAAENYAIFCRDDLTITDSNVTATSEAACAFSSSGGSLTISGDSRLFAQATDSAIELNNGFDIGEGLGVTTPTDGYVDGNFIKDSDGNTAKSVVIERLSTYSVTVTPGANMTKTSGAASQNVTPGDAMERVVYMASEGYYFPEDYAVASVNGVAVTRDSFTQITVSGTPTWNAAITLTAPMAKGASVVTKAPEANTLSYSGSAQALVTAGTATGGELQYALGSETEATGAYSTSIPTAANAGTYYVWYKVIGDANHNDSKAAFVKVTISEKKANPTAPATTTQKKKETAPVKTNRLLNLKGSQTGSKITIKWTRIPDASMYKVYGAYCGKKMKLLKTIKGNTTIKAVFPKLNGKEINLKKEYKFRVIAYKTAGGKTKQISKSFDVHITGRNNAKYTSAKAIKVTKKNYRLEAGKKAKIKVKLVLANKKKKALPVSHGPRFRYVSSNKAVASVSKNGKITAKKAGTCTIYVYAINGCAAKVKVVVK